MPEARIWIDLDNSPHVPFFNPIIRELRNLSYEVVVTARDCSQTCGLADLLGLEYQKVGRHYGKHKALKILGTLFRAAQLIKTVGKEEPSLAVSHGSRAQMLSAALLRVPSLTMADYEHTKGDIRTAWVMVPEVIGSDSLRSPKERTLRYPGIKEDVYVPYFKPDPSILDELRIDPSELIVTIRPPATEAHYHNPESETLFLEAVNRIGMVESSRMVILPRNDTQKAMVTSVWNEWCSRRKIVIPEQVVNGLNLLWHSDFAISGGGTMNREAAALGVPVYSIFRGKIGAVDKYLAECGRLILLETIENVRTKLSIARRNREAALPTTNGKTLKCVVKGIITALNSN